MKMSLKERSGSKRPETSCSGGEDEPRLRGFQHPIGLAVPPMRRTLACRWLSRVGLRRVELVEVLGGQPGRLGKNLRDAR